MPSFKLDRENSVESALFERFAKFLTKIKYPNERKMKVGLIHKYTGELLSGDDLPALSEVTVRDYFIETEPYIEIDEDRFKRFCSNFIQIFSELSPEARMRYTAINAAFIEWQDKIYRREGWTVEIISNIEQLTDAEVNESSFLQAIGTMRAYYSNDERFDNEREMFNSLEELIDKRTRFHNLLFSNKIDSFEFVNRLLKWLTSSSWTFFEKENDSVIKNVIRFNHYSYDYHFSQDKISELNDENSFLVLDEFRMLKGSEIFTDFVDIYIWHGYMKISQIISYNIRHHFFIPFDHTLPAFLTGYKTVFDEETGSIIGNRVLIQRNSINGENADKESCIVLPFNDSLIPDYIRDGLTNLDARTATEFWNNPPIKNFH